MNIFEQFQQSLYDDWGTSPPQHKWNSPARTTIEIKFLKRVLNPTPEHLLLDVFCSWGRHVFALAREGLTVIGLDLSIPMLTYACQQRRPNGVQATFIQADLQALPLVDSIDFVYSIQSSPFEAWRSPDTVLNMLTSVHRALKTGGKYVMGWNDDSTLAANVEPYLRKRLADTGITTYDERSLPLHHYGRLEQTALLNQAGFQVEGLFNDYTHSTPYKDSQPGLIVVAGK